MVITVAGDQEVSAVARGRVLHRVGTDCVGLDPSTRQRLREGRRGFDASSLPTAPTPRRRRTTQKTRADAQLAPPVEPDDN